MELSDERDKYIETLNIDANHIDTMDELDEQHIQI